MDDDDGRRAGFVLTGPAATATAIEQAATRSGVHGDADSVF
jgi:hypothetical protein